MLDSKIYMYRDLVPLATKLRFDPSYRLDLPQHSLFALFTLSTTDNKT